MRTPEQIRNLRVVFTMMFGPYIYFVSDALIDQMADIVQYRIDEEGANKWEIKTKIRGHNLDKSWEEIEKEPNTLIASLRTIRAKCQTLLTEYPNLEAIQISDSETHLKTYVFDREH